MMLTNLEWLPAAGGDFRARLRAIEETLTRDPGAEVFEPVVGLATAALDETQLSRLATLSARLGAASATGSGFLRAKLGVLGDGTLSLYGAPLIGSALRHGLILEVVEGEYGAAVQQSIDPTSALRAAGLDFALVVSDLRLTGLDQAAGSPEDAERKVEAALSRLRMIVEALRPSVASSILVQTVPPPIDPLFGSFDRVLPESPFSMVLALNRRIAEWAAEGGVILVDAARLAATVGLENWDEPAHWHASKLPFAPAMLPLWADVVVRVIAAIRGRARKCLVLDLDNTVWGGVIGDDGIAGIKLGQGSAVGEAHLAVQRLALALRARGVVLAVCSKNEDDAARLPFREHPDMLLREDDIAVFQANWTDKASNLRAIAKTLNIGVDALVFLDDNPAERMQVRRELPLVGVPELPDDAALYTRALAAAGYFEAVAFSKEDRERAGYYQANAQRAAALTATGDIEGYLASLDMVCSIGRVDAVTRPRVSQLINKSNQFNLTTHRYSESEVQAAEQDPRRHAIQIRLVDRFGDNGIISVVIADLKGEAWEIDTWLMSCRVLGRRVEQAALAHLAAAALADRATHILGRYIPSPKNRMVADHYGKLGFRLMETSAEGVTLWRLDLADYAPPTLPMRIDDTALTRSSVAA
jgi:FkbH-like protein